MKASVLIASGVVAAQSAFAATENKMPKICETAVNYAVTAVDRSFSDGAYANVDDPDSIVLKKDLNAYPIKRANYLGSCDDAGMKASWCRTASPITSVWSVDVSEKSGDADYDHSTVIVTYGRGSCQFDEIVRK